MSNESTGETLDSCPWRLRRSKPIANRKAAMIEAMIEAFVLQSSIASTNHGNQQDDLLAVMQLFTKQHGFESTQLSAAASSGVEHTFLSEMYRVLGTSVDYALDSNPDLLFRNPMIQRFLSMQVSLSYAGEEKHRSLPAKTAWAILNLRFIALCFALVFKKPPGPPVTENETKKPGTSQELAWSIFCLHRSRIDSVIVRYMFMDYNAYQLYRRRPFLSRSS